MGKKPKENTGFEEVQTVMRLPADLHRGLRLLAMTKGVSMNSLVQEAVARLLKSDANEVETYIQGWKERGAKGHLFDPDSWKK